MPWYLRKALKLGPLRINFSKSGIGLSFGVKGARVGIGPRGSYLHAGRHGFYLRESLGIGGKGRAGTQELEPHAGIGTPAVPVCEIPGLPASTANCGEAVRALMNARPQCWEYLLFAAALRECIDKADSFIASNAPSGGSFSVGDDKVLGDTQEVLEGISTCCKRLDEVMNGDLQKALGPPGQPSNLDGLVATARSITANYAGLIVIRNHSLSLSPSPRFQPYMKAVAGAADGIAEEIRGFPEKCREGIAHAIEASRSGQPQGLKLTLAMRVDEDKLHSALEYARLYPASGLSGGSKDDGGRAT